MSEKYFLKEPPYWREMADGSTQYVSNPLMAVLGGVGPAKTEGFEGQFWWHIKSTPIEEQSRGYCETLELAKKAAEDWFARSCTKEPPAPPVVLSRRCLMLYPMESEMILKVLRDCSPTTSAAAFHEREEAIKLLEERSEPDELDEAYANAAIGKGEEEDSYDQDEAAVSRGDDPGAYVAMWVWVRNDELPDEIIKKFNLQDDEQEDEEESEEEGSGAGAAADA